MSVIDTARPNVLDVRQVSIRFGGLTALDEISFGVRAGEILGLIGPNGAGKSTVLNCICGVYRPTSGAVFIGGDDTTGSTTHRMRSRGVARTFQETLLVDDLNLVDNLLLGRTTLRKRDMIAGLFNLPRTRRHFRVEHQAAVDLLTEYGLAEWADTPAASVPYGVRKLVEVARAQFTSPRLLLLDEPAAGLGPVDAEHLAARLIALADTGVAIVLIDHNIDFVASAVHRVVVMNAGGLLAEGTPAEVRADPRVTEAYLGRGRNHDA